MHVFSLNKGIILIQVVFEEWWLFERWLFMPTYDHVSSCLYNRLKICYETIDIGQLVWCTICLSTDGYHHHQRQQQWIHGHEQLCICMITNGQNIPILPHNIYFYEYIRFLFRLFFCSSVKNYQYNFTIKLNGWGIILLINPRIIRCNTKHKLTFCNGWWSPLTLQVSVGIPFLLDNLVYCIPLFTALEYPIAVIVPAVHYMHSCLRSIG